LDLSALTLHQLRIFHAVACHGNLTRAAEQLGISQPAVSIQVKQLEKILGLPLLESVGRGLQLTELGTIVDDHAVRVLKEVDQLSETVMEMRGIERGSLMVAADTTVGIYVMPPMLGAWHQQHPNVEVGLRVGNHDLVCQLLRNNDVDLAVVSTIPDIEGLDVEPFLPNRLVVIAPPEHPLALSGRKVAAGVLAEEPFLVRESGSSSRSAVESFCEELGIALRIAMRLGSIGAIKQGVASGLGLAVVSERAVGNELALGALVVLEVEGFPIELTWNIVHYQAKRLSPSARSFKTFLESARSTP
jgi:DNA-binding transcriptional LysR family regulator